MRTLYLEYYKVVLEKVSFDRRIFRREYIKAQRVRSNKEIGKLNKWLEKNRLVEYVEV